MKLGGKAGIRASLGALLGASAIVLTSFGVTENPYNAIVERNVFNLHPPPPPVNPADLIKKTPPPKITLTGITTILGQKKTFLTYPPTKPNTPPNSVMLAEGQAQDEIEVKSIDEKAGVVQIVNHGEPQTLDFEHDGAKPSGPPSGMPAGSPMSFPAPVPAPPPNGVQPMQNPGNVIRPLRSLQSQSRNDNNNGEAGLGGSMNVAQQNKGENITPEEQVALIELQRYQSIQQGTPIQNLLPPTALTPEITGKPAVPDSGF
jgi:hypothetical protein